MSTPATASNSNKDADFGASAAILPEDEKVEPKRRTSTATTDKDQVDCSGLYADVGFLFEGQQATKPTRVETFKWNNLPDGRSITVQCRCVVRNNDDDNDNEDAAPARPGASSGHYLWPAARQLAEYLVRQVQTTGCSTIVSMNHPPTTVVELGAGCALLSCVALQLWQPTLECLVVTDHDAAALERARDNYETTLQALLDRSTTEEDLNAAINTTASICFQFCALPWGTDTRPVRAMLGEHSAHRRADVILGSDLLYDTAVVQPLLQTAKDLLATHGVFYLAQSYNLEDAGMDAAVTIACVNLGLERQILSGGSSKDCEGFSIQAFTLQDEVGNSPNSFDEGDATPTPSPTSSSNDEKDDLSSGNNDQTDKGTTNGTQ